MMDYSFQECSATLTVALIGNPNCGKSSVFNQLTGLRQKVGNFPGVTVDKKLGKVCVDDRLEATLIDFPGTYSFYPTSQDERIVVQTFSNPNDENFPDAVVYIADIVRLEKHLLLFTQLRDLGLPAILALNMSDVAEKEGLMVDADQLSVQLEAPVVRISGRTGAGMGELQAELLRIQEKLSDFQAPEPFYRLSAAEQHIARGVREIVGVTSDYQALLVAHHHQWLPFLNKGQREKLAVLTRDFESIRAQVDETMNRYDRFTPIAQRTVRRAKRPEDEGLTERIDRVLTHPVAGPFIFFVLMLLVFQAIFAWASYPMDMIEFLFGVTGEWLNNQLPDRWYTRLLTDGILAGLGGILVFIPQIAILFFLISLLEEVGYMARAAYLFDRLMQLFGLNGRSIVALISGGACAIPAIMSTRTIGNWKERLVTILVTPLISCSARIPVYTVLIAFAVPSATVAGIFNLQGLAFMGLYMLGIVAALLSALVFKYVLQSREMSFLMLELPEYRTPVMRNVLITVWEKVKTFVLEAGRIIMIISVILWVLASYGPTEDMALAESEARAIAAEQQLDETATRNLIAAKEIEASFAGHLGKAIEPAIAPLGFDWKIGIALVTSFAAREVFVGTMATIYSIGSEQDEYAVRSRMAAERRPDTGLPVYDTATSWSLLIFYVFAMMCMSTLAVVKRETKSWKWPAIQFFFMTGLAYLSSLLVYQLLQG